MVQGYNITVISVLRSVEDMEEGPIWPPEAAETMEQERSSQSRISS